MGLPDEFVEHGTQKELHHILKIDPEGIVERVKSFCRNKSLNREITI
jgi:1-deoxy-D-xylulose-5-phosphate synthase